MKFSNESVLIPTLMYTSSFTNPRRIVTKSRLDIKPNAAGADVSRVSRISFSNDLII